MRKISLEEFEDRIAKRFPEEKFSVILYSTIGKEAAIKCLQCENEIKISKANNFLAKNKAYGCRECHGLHHKRAEKIASLLQDYDLIGERVVGTHTIHTLKCKECGHIRSTRLSNFMKSPKCGCETGTFRRTKESFEEEFHERTNNEYELMEKFNGMLEKILVKHRRCNFSFRIRPSDLFYNGVGKCPVCYKKESSNCHFITSLLLDQKVAFEKEKRMGKTRQFFDFFLNDYNLAIEYNGEQHYSFNSKFHTNNNDFLAQVDRDRRKKEYCEENGIKLVIVPHYKKRLEIKGIILSLFSESSTTKVGEVPENSVLPEKEDDIVYSPVKAGAEREGK